MKLENEASVENNQIVKNENSGDLRNVPTFENVINVPTIETQKTHVCEYCGKPYTHQQYLAGLLNKHVRIVHEGIKDFKCHLCGNMFTERGSLGKFSKNIWNFKFGFRNFSI